MASNFSNQDMNQFSISPVRGMIAEGVSPNLGQVHIDPANTDVFTAGTFVTLDETSTLEKGTIVRKALATESGLGIVVYNTVENEYSNANGKTSFTIAFPNIKIYMQASGTIERGDRLSIDNSNPDGIPRVKKALEGENVMGLADEPAQADDIFKISHI